MLYESLSQVSWATRVFLEKIHEVAWVVKSPPANARDRRHGFDPLGWEDLLEKKMAARSRILAWKKSTDRGALWATDIRSRVGHKWEPEHTGNVLGSATVILLWLWASHCFVLLLSFPFLILKCLHINNTGGTQVTANSSWLWGEHFEGWGMKNYFLLHCILNRFHFSISSCICIMCVCVCVCVCM